MLKCIFVIIIANYNKTQEGFLIICRKKSIQRRIYSCLVMCDIMMYVIMMTKMGVFLDMFIIFLTRPIQSPSYPLPFFKFWIHPLNWSSGLKMWTQILFNGVFSNTNKGQIYREISIHTVSNSQLDTNFFQLAVHLWFLKKDYFLRWRRHIDYDSLAETIQTTTTSNQPHQSNRLPRCRTTLSWRCASVSDAGTTSWQRARWSS